MVIAAYSFLLKSNQGLKIPRCVRLKESAMLVEHLAGYVRPHKRLTRAIQGIEMNEREGLGSSLPMVAGGSNDGSLLLLVWVPG